MGKRTITILLAVTLMLSCLFSFAPKAYAIGSYGVNLDSAAYVSNTNPFYASGLYGQCTWYCWGRAYEKGVYLYWGSSYYGNAIYWYNNAQGYYTCDTSPSANSIMVSPDGGYTDDSGVYHQTGHVMYVEKVENGVAYISEANYAGNVYHEDYINLSNNRRNWGSGGYLNITGYIHLPVDTTYYGSEMTSGAGKTLLDGDYEIICAADTTYQLDVVGTTIPAANGANVRIYQRLATPRQKDIFTVTYLNNGFYKIVQKGTSMSLDVNNASTAEGENIQMWPTHDSSAQKWSIERAPINGTNKAYRIRPKCSGLALDVNNGTFANQTNVQQWRVNDTAAQGWLFIPYQPAQPIENGRYILLSALDTSYELDVAGNSASISSGTNVRIWKDTGCQSRYNSFDITKQSNGYYKITNAASGLALGVSGGGSVFGQNIAVLTAADSDAQRWAITKSGSGYVLRVRSSGYALDVENSTVNNGTNVSQYPASGTTNQIWKFVKAEHTVEYKANGGSGAPAAQTKYYKSDLTLSSTKPTRTGYTFLGWNTSSNATTAAYQPGGKYTTDADLGLYAIWKANNYTVTFNANGGNVSTTSKTVTYDAAYGTLPTPNWTGHRFDGWFTAVSGGSKVTSSTTVKTAKNHTLYAHWTDINPFVDVKEGKYYYNAVLWAYYYSPQITNGTDETHFSPSKDCTREQIVTFLWKAAGAPEPSSTNNPFTDVKSSKYYYKAVLWAVQNGITNGISADKFGVGQPCKREQVVTFLWKTAGAPDPETTENPFTDVKEGKYYYKAVMWAVENKITSGVSADKFGVGQTCTRGQIVTFLYKYMEG